MFSEAIKDIPAKAGDDAVNVFVETPKGSRQKYDLHESGLFRVTLELPDGMFFPFSFGFVPNTLADDGDPLDIVLITDGQLPAGSIVEARLIGVLEMENDEDGEMVRNDRVLAVANVSRIFSDLHDAADMRTGMMWDLETFFASYNEMIERPFRAVGRGDRTKARELLERAVERAEAG